MTLSRAPRRILRISRGTLLPIALSAGVASGQEAQALPSVTILGNYDYGIGASDAASEGRVNQRLIESRPLLRTGELLEFVPGMIVTQHSGDGKANQYFLRGFNLDHGTDFATFVDGMPVNMRTHAHGQGYSDLNFMIPELVMSIDYRKGPYAAEDGDFASAGSARLRLASSLDRGLASMTRGEHDFWRGVVADSVRLGPGTLLGGLEVGYNNGPWANAGHARRAKGLLRWSQGAPGDGWSVTAMGYQANWRGTDQIPLRAVDDGALDRFGAIDPSDGGSTSRYSLSASATVPNAPGAARVSAYAIASRLHLYSDFTYFLDDPIGGDQFEQFEKRLVYGFDASQRIDGHLGRLPMENTVGASGRDDHLDPVALYRNVDRRRFRTTREDRVRESTLGVYAENRVTWSDWLRSVAGVRCDAGRFRVVSSIAGNSGRVHDRLVSPKASLVFGPWARTELFLNYGQGFHSNDARGTTATVAPADGSPIDRAAPLVKTRGMEVGARTEWIPGLQSSLAVWRLDLDSELVFVGDAGDTEPSRASRRHGVELNNHYLAAPWLIVDADLAWSHARYRGDDPRGNFIPGAIDKVASLGVTVGPIGRWSGQLQWRYFGPRPLVEDDSVRSKSTAITSARVSYALAKNLTLSLDVFNLFDRKASDIDYFYTSRLAGEPASGVDDVHFHPVEPRAGRVTLASRF